MVVKMLEYKRMEGGVWRSPGPLVHFLGSQEAGQPGCKNKDLLVAILRWLDHNFKYGPKKIWPLRRGGQPGRESKDLLEEILPERDDNFRYGPCSATEVTKFRNWIWALRRGVNLEARGILSSVSLKRGLIIFSQQALFPDKGFLLAQK